MDDMSVVSLVDETRVKRPLMGVNGRVKSKPRIVNKQRKQMTSSETKKPSRHESEPENPVMPSIHEREKPTVLVDKPKKLSDAEIIFGTTEDRAHLINERSRPRWDKLTLYGNHKTGPRYPVMPSILESMNPVVIDGKPKKLSDEEVIFGTTDGRIHLMPERPRPGGAMKTPHGKCTTESKNLEIPPILEPEEPAMLECTSKKLSDEEIVFGTIEERAALMPERPDPDLATNTPRVFYMSPNHESASTVGSATALREQRRLPRQRSRPFNMANATYAKIIVFLIICCLLVGTLGFRTLTCWFV